MISIVYKTDDYVIINKAPGTPSAMDNSGDIDAMSECASLLRASGEREELYLIHRLDRVVGGLMVFARNKHTAAQLSRLVAERDFTKEYLAVIDGAPEDGEMVDYLSKNAVLNKAIVFTTPTKGAKLARLSFRQLDTKEVNGKPKSLVRVHLDTGRFHQIRAQFSSRKMPLIGDKKYGSRDFGTRHLALFATRISFDIGDETIDFKAVPDISEYPWSLFDARFYEGI